MKYYLLFMNGPILPNSRLLLLKAKQIIIYHNIS